MVRDTDENKLINRYLLGELSEDELAQVEERYFADENFFAQVLDAENSLVDSYVRGNFSAVERGKFEKQFLTTPQRRQKIKFAQSLNRAIIEAQTNAETNVIAFEDKPTIAKRETSWWQSLVGSFNIQGPALALGMGAILLMFLGIWQISEMKRNNRSSDIAEVTTTSEERNPLESNRQSRIDENAQITNERTSLLDSTQKPVNSQTGEQLGRQKQQSEKESAETVVSPKKQAGSENSQSEKSSPPQPQPVVATIVLIPGLVRGEDGKRAEITIPPRTNQIRLQLNLEEDLYPRYRAVLQSPDGTEVWKIRLPQMKKKNGKSVTLLVPAKVLSKGDYTMVLKGETKEREIENVSEYPFSIVKK